MRYLLFILAIVIFSVSCESKEERLDRIKLEIETKKAEARLLAKTEALENNEKLRQEKLEKEAREKRAKELAGTRARKKAEKKERKRKQTEYDRWKDNSLYTGATPWSDCFGSKNECDAYGCSQISVKTPYNSDVIVTLKRNGDVVRHAYIKKSSTHTFELSNGSYQPFFYYGNGWNPNSSKRSKTCGSLPGSFIRGEHISKDIEQPLSNNILSYELILQENGNLQTKPSNEEEAF